MKREFLRGLGLEEETVQKIIDEHHDSLRDYKNKEESLNEQLDAANTEISNRDQQIQELQDKVGDNEGLKKELEEYKNSNAEFETKMKDLKINNAIKTAVAKEANDPDDILAFIDKADLKLDGDTVVGLEEKVSALKESKPYLFEQPSVKKGRTPLASDGNKGFCKEEIMKIKDPTTRQKAIEDNIQLFN